MTGHEQDYQLQDADRDPDLEGDPLERERQFLEERLAPLSPKGQPGGPAATPEPSELDEGGPLPEAEQLPPDYRQQMIRQYRARQRHHLEQIAAQATPVADEDDIEPGQAPQPPPANNWVPIGPSVLRQGQGAVKPATSGRTPAIAVTPGGNRVYIGSHNGGVWRTDDAGQSWRPLMNAFDLDPTTQASDTLACGAIAVVPGSPDRVYVGSGEGDAGRFFGVGAVVSFDSGQNWVTEPVAPGSPPLAGSAFYALAVDPADPERVVAGTRQGLYRRELNGGGGFHWSRKMLGTAARVASVAVARSGATTTFYAARWGGPVYTSTDGDTWAVAGTGFPSSNVGRMSLAVQPDNPSVVYVLITANSDASALGVWRLDTADTTWRQVTGHPTNLFGTTAIGFQGTYDSAMAVDPSNVDRLFLGGSTISSGGDWSGSLFRSTVTSSGAGAAVTYSMSNTYIGNSVHADIHTIVFAPGDASKLWVGCDGGVYATTNPTGSGDIFVSRNIGLQTLSMNFLAQHPSEDAVLFSGTQDNGGVRFTGEEAWLYSSGGDGGYAVVNWNDPYKVLSTYVRGGIRRSTDGGARYSYSSVNVPLNSGEQVLFYAPIAATPVNVGAPSEAEIVAFGSIRPWISTNFGTSWQSIPNGTLAADSLDERIRSLCFASATKLYAGTMAGGVYRFDRSGGAWSRTQIDTVGGANALPLGGPVTSLAADPADASGNSIYLTFGGTGDYRHVWHFDGAQWAQRSGPAAGALTSLLDVQTNAIAVDPANPTDVYAGADIGIWRSTDGGSTWQTFSEGLPDAGVLDLALHNDRRLLRAATHGRSVFERTLPAGPKPGVELYVRDTQLDQGRFPTIDFLPDPTRQGEIVRHWRGPDIKLDTPDVLGQYQFPVGSSIDFHQFDDILTDDSRNVATHATATITTRVYVQVHNRGVVPTSKVQVMLLLANASAGLPPLPAGYEANVQSATPITTANWQTIGVVALDDVQVGFPKIAAFDLTSDKLPPPANLAGNDHHCVLALLHHVDDPFTSTVTVTDTLSLTERKAAHKNLKVVQFIGTPPEVAPVILPIRIHNPYPEEIFVTDVMIDVSAYRGRIRLYLPPLELDGDIAGLIEGLQLSEDFADFRWWAEQHFTMIEENQHSEHPYNTFWAEQRIGDIQQALQSAIMLEGSAGGWLAIRRIIMLSESYHTLFLMFDRPPDGQEGETFAIQVLQTDSHREQVLGGQDLRIDLVPAIA